MHKHNINRHVHDVYMYMHSMFRCKVRRCTCTYKAKDIYDISHKILPIQSILRVPVQNVWTSNGTERKGTELPFSFSSFFLLYLRVKVLQLQLASTAPGFVLRRLSAFPQQKHEQQNPNLWWLGLCTMAGLVHGTNRSLMLQGNSTEITIPLHDQ